MNVFLRSSWEALSTEAKGDSYPLAMSPLSIAITVAVSGMGVLQILLVRIAIAQVEIRGRLENLATFT
jgi:hypothetical protein